RRHGRLARLPAGSLHHRRGHPGRRRVAPLPILISHTARRTRSGTVRQMVMVGFLQAQNCTPLASAWRHPDARSDFTSAAYYQKIGQVLEEGKFQLAFFDDRLAMPDIYGGNPAPGVATGVRG